MERQLQVHLNNLLEYAWQNDVTYREWSMWLVAFNLTRDTNTLIQPPVTPVSFATQTFGPLFYWARTRTHSMDKVRTTEVTPHSKLKYPLRLNLFVVSSIENDIMWLIITRYSYDKPPLDDITLEDFEEYALDRLRVLAEIESCFVRNRTWENLKEVTIKQCNNYLKLSHSTATNEDLDSQRRKDHVSHFILRLAFCRT